MGRDLGTEPSVASARLQHLLDSMLARSLPHIALAFGGVLLLYAALHPWLLPYEEAARLGAVTAIVALLFVATGVFLRRRPLPPEWAHAACAAGAAVATLHAALLMHVTGDPAHTIYFALLALGAGLFILSSAWLLGLLSMFLLAWTLVALLHPQDGWAGYGFILLAATTLAGLGHGLRSSATGELAGQRLAEAAARRRFQALSDAAHEGVLLVEQGRVTDANRAAGPLFGLPPEGLLERDVEALLGGAVPDDDVRTVGGRHLHIRRTRLPSGDVVLVRDVTAEQEAQERERLVARLQEQDEIRRRFLDRLGQELNDHLMPLMDHAESLRLGAHGSLAPRQQKAVKIMESEMRQLDWLIQELLDTARVDTERLELERDIVDLEDLAETCLGAARAVFEHKGVQLRVDGLETAWVRGDSRRLEQIVKEMLDHALRASPRDGFVKARLRTEDEEAVLEVEHMGGVGPGGEEALFMPFPEDEPAHGVGLGLFVARGIAQRHGGTLTALALGPLVRFCFRIPLETEDATVER